ncbi:MAG: hypothetical protein QOJ41_2531, partial [Acidobacteriaceae bacterium]|nr:hypothetical protein [Acidobacteriaceae bacterium]
MNYLALADDGLLNTTNVLLIGNRRNLHRNLQADFVIGMHARGDFHVSTDIDVLELGVFTRGLTKLAAELEPTPAWKLPVATGTRSPMFNFAACPSIE